MRELHHSTFMFSTYIFYDFGHNYWSPWGFDGNENDQEETFRLICKL